MSITPQHPTKHSDRKATPMHTNPPRGRRNRAFAGVVVALLVVTAACGSDSDDADSTTAATEIGVTEPAAESAPAAETTPGTDMATDTTMAGDTGVTADGISTERCAANEAAGTITYLSSFDFAASASIIDVVTASEKGYFEDMCLDVELKPSFSTRLVSSDRPALPPSMRVMLTDWPVRKS